MKILLDIFSDYGTIISSSSEAASGNMKAKNVINQVPQIWKTTSNTIHSVVGSLAFIDSADYTPPLDSYYVSVDYAPIGTQFTLEIFSDLMLPASYTYSFTNTSTAEIFYSMGDHLTVGKYWKLKAITPFSSIIKISRVMVGQAWLPNIGVSGDVSLNKNPYIKGERQRNGGVYIPPSINYKTNTISYRELNKDSLFTLQDALSRYGTGTTIFIEGLIGTSAFTFTSIYGRLIKWTEPEKSISGNYAINLTIEESI